MHQKNKELLLLGLIMIGVFLLSFIEYNNMYFFVSIPISISLVFLNEKYFLCSYLMIILSSVFINFNYLLGVTLIGLITSILFFIIYRKTKIKLSYLTGLISFITGVIYSLIGQIYLGVDYITVIIYPFLVLLITYLFSELIINQKSKDEFSFTQMELIYVSVLINFIILKSDLVLFGLDISLILSGLLIYSLIQINTNCALVSTLLSVFAYAPFAGEFKLLLLILPLLFILKFIAKFIKLRAIVFMAIVLTLSSVFKNYDYLVESGILTLFYLSISENFYIRFGKYIVDVKDYKIKRYRELYYDLLNKDKKINSLLTVIEEKIQETPRMKKKYSDKLAEDLRFLINETKDETDTDIKEKIIEELSYIDIELLSLRLKKDYQQEITIALESRFYNDYKKLINIIESVSKRKISMKLCKYNFLTNSIRYEFVSEEEYSFEYFVRQRSLDEKCGDNYLCFKANNKKYFLISDGMGHGDKANEDSKFALYLIKNFIELGMEAKKAIESCNALIYSKSDTYNTLDLLEYNCFNNDIVLYKNGSSNTYVEYPDRIDKLTSENLPLGIIDEINVNKININTSVKRIVMTSDGVEENLVDILEDNKRENVKVLVDQIFSQNNNYNDDQTIMAINVIKR